MIKVKQPPAIAYRTALTLETTLSAVCTAFLGCPAKAFYWPICPGRDENEIWCNLRHKNGAELNFAVLGLVRPGTKKVNYLTGVVNLGAKLALPESDETKGWKIKGGFGADEMERDCDHYKLKTEVGETLTLLSAFTPSTQHYVTNICGAQDMSEGDFSATINLGRIELSIADLIGLREGMEIVCEKPSRLEGTLQAHGLDFADISINITDSGLRLIVQKLLRGRAA